MNKLTSTAVVAIVAGTISLAAPAFAQQGPNHPGQQPGQPGNEMQMQMPGHFGNQRIERMHNARNGVRPGALLDLVCTENGAERTEIGFVRLAYRLELTPEQQTLFDDLKASALTAQTQFADQCEKPSAAEATAGTPATAPTPVERLEAQIGNDTVRLELMQGLLPKLEALYNSLTDAQKATLQPPARDRDGHGFRQRHGQMQQPGQMPGQPDAAAPATPDAAPTAFIIG